jgi:hypothetical protein
MRLLGFCEGSEVWHGADIAGYLYFLCLPDYSSLIIVFCECWRAMALVRGIFNAEAMIAIDDPASADWRWADRLDCISKVIPYVMLNSRVCPKKEELYLGLGDWGTPIRCLVAPTDRGIHAISSDFEKEAGMVGEYAQPVTQLCPVRRYRGTGTSRFLV